MKITAKARYGLRILLDIALNSVPEHPRTIKEISAGQEISEKFISRLVVALREHGMIHSERGRVGGFRLAKSPSDISLLDVIEAVEGQISVVDCLENQESCTRSAGCAARFIWGDVNSAIRASLKEISLESIISRIAGPDMIPSMIAEYCI